VRTQHTGVAPDQAATTAPAPHVATPLPDTSGPLGAIVARIRTKGLRYCMVSVVNVLLGAGLLYVLQRWMRPTFANITSVAIGAVPAYYMSRAWVWGKRGKSHWKKEVLPFWIFTGAGLILSTAAISFTDDHTKNRVAILFVQLSAFGVLWVLRFFLLDKLFHVEIYEDDTPDED
jgi:putative flippase GtrA